MKIYIAGPMRGYTRWNFDAFDKAAEYLHSIGHTPISPAAVDRALGADPDNATDCTGNEMRKFLSRDCLIIAQECDALVVLRGWSDSLGATAEVAFANAIDIPVYKYLRDVPESRTESC